MRVTAKGHGQVEKPQKHVSQLEEVQGNWVVSGNSQKQREKTVVSDQPWKASEHMCSQVQ